jgi:oxygen-independent coproporphyrinogen-3 oxidase
LNYWRGGDYVGLGLGAVSTVGGKRYTNSDTFDMYEHHIREGGKPVLHVEELGQAELITERVMLALRQSAGMDFEELPGTMDLSKNPIQRYVSGLIEAGFAESDESRLRLTPAGFLRSNIIITDIIGIIEKSQNGHS